MNRQKAILLLVATATLWSMGGLLIKLVNWNPIAIAGMRSAIAALLIFAFIKRPHFNWSFAQITGALAYAATVILFVSANKMTTAANAIVLQYTSPIFVAILGIWLLKERVKTLDWVSIFLVMGGMLLFFLDNLDTGGFIGNILAILSGISFAITIISLRSQKDASPLESVLLGNIVTALVGIPFMFGTVPDTKSWVVLGVLGIFQLGFSYILYTTAIKHVTALEAILIPVLEPLLNPIFVLIFLGESPGTWSLIGGCIVITSLTLRCLLPMLKVNKSADPARCMKE